jgi:hypothetical protein
MATGLLSGIPALAPAQVVEVQPPAPIIERVVIDTENVFSEEEIRKNAIFRFLNSIRFETSPRVVRKELLFAPGSTLDSAQLAETERNLRRLGIFRTVDVDTVTQYDSLQVTVRTRDAWSSARVAPVPVVTRGSGWRHRSGFDRGRLRP